MLQSLAPALYLGSTPTPTALFSMYSFVVLLSSRCQYPERRFAAYPTLVIARWPDQAGADRSRRAERPSEGSVYSDFADLDGTGSHIRQILAVLQHDEVERQQPGRMRSTTSTFLGDIGWQRHIIPAVWDKPSSRERYGARSQLE